MLPVRIDEPLLKEIAATTGGRYFRATDSEALARIFRQIDGLEKTPVQVTRYLHYEELTKPLAIAGLLLLVLELGMEATVAVGSTDRRLDVAARPRPAVGGRRHRPGLVGPSPPDRRDRRVVAIARRVGALRGGSGPWLVGIALLCGAVAVAGPRGGRTSVKTEARALSLVIATDISRSMLAEDVQPSRLGRAKREARRLVQDLDGDRLGLIAFAGRSYILTPLTVDGGAVSLYLDGLDPDLASEGARTSPPR